MLFTRNAKLYCKNIANLVLKRVAQKLILMITESNVETFTKKRQNLLLKKYVECKKHVIKNILSAKNTCKTKINMQNHIQYISVYLLAVLVNLCAL